MAAHTKNRNENGDSAALVDPVAAPQEKPPQIVTLGTLDSAALLERYGAQTALAEAQAAEIARGVPADATLH